MKYPYGRRLRVRYSKKYHIGKRPHQTNIVNPFFVIAIVVATFLIGSLAGAHLNNKVNASEALSSDEPISIPVKNQLAIQPTTKPDNVEQVFHIEPEVQKFIENWVKNNSNNGIKWSIYVQGLGGDTRIAMYNANDKQTIASLYKLFLIRPLSLRLSPTKWDSKKILGKKTIQPCVIDMIQVSDTRGHQSGHLVEVRNTRASDKLC